MEYAKQLNREVLTLKFSKSFIKKFRLFEGVAVVAMLTTYFVLKHKFGIYYNISCKDFGSSSCSSQSSKSATQQQNTNLPSTQNSTSPSIEDFPQNYPEYTEIGSAPTMDSITI